MSIHAQDKRTGADTRQLILAAAVELFSDRGYAGTSMRDIAESTGMTKAALYYHFESKEQILEAVSEPLRSEMERLVTKVSGTPAPAPSELLTDLVDLLSRHSLLIRTVFNDPSAFSRGHHDQAKACMQTFACILAGATPLAEGAEGTAVAGPTSPTELVRARAALGAVQAGVLGTTASDPRFIAPHHGDLLAMLGGKRHALEPGLRREVVAAAIRALG